MPSKKIDQIVQVKIARHVVKATKSKIDIFKKEIIQYLDTNGYLSWSSKERK
ncbi:MAG: DNA topoisomerase, partial [Thermoproteota archaeon]